MLENVGMPRQSTGRLINGKSVPTRGTHDRDAIHLDEKNGNVPG
jgi:hypothetical protein